MSDLDEYWKVSVEECLSELNIQVSKSQFEQMVRDMTLSSEMESEAKGYHFIPDPREAEDSAEIEKLKERIKDLEYREGCFVRSVASRRNCDVTDVYIDNSGQVIYRP